MTKSWNWYSQWNKMKVAFLVRYNQLLSTSWKNKTARQSISMEGAREKGEYFFSVSLVVWFIGTRLGTW